jgi:hypothetical protein
MVSVGLEMSMAVALQNCSAVSLHELIIDGVDEELNFPAERNLQKETLSEKSEADIAVEEFLDLTRARCGFGPVASLFKAYLRTVEANSQNLSLVA